MSDQLNLSNMFKIVVEVKSNPYQSDYEIYTALGFSRSAFYKYKKRLADSFGFVFRYSRKLKRFVIEKEPFIPTLNLTMGELFSLVFSMNQLSASGGDYIIAYRAFKAVKKLIAQYPDRQVREQLALLMSEALCQQRCGCQEEILNTVERAADSKQILRIRYYSVSSQKEDTFEIEPYMIYFKRRALYLDAYSRSHEEILMFRIGRIKKAEILPFTGFEIRPDYSFTERHRYAFSVFGGPNPQLVRIRFSPKVAPMIAEVIWHWSQKISPDPNRPGGIIFEVTVAYPPEVIWWMRQWGAEAEVLEPQEMREYARDMARRELELYQQGD